MSKGGNLLCLLLSIVSFSCFGMHERLKKTVSGEASKTIILKNELLKKGGHFSQLPITHLQLTTYDPETGKNTMTVPFSAERHELPRPTKLGVALLIRSSCFCYSQTYGKRVDITDDIHEVVLTVNEKGRLVLETDEFSEWEVINPEEERQDS
jgi:hypothetical protein